ncbi:hypothetical protein GQR58_018356 [Nymphon striatum]|nr:hypothetical protein GQR58_018356 [Nymphon striatum]
MDFATNDGAISDLGQGKNTGWGMAVDVAAAFLFRYSYALIGSDHYLAALGCLILASVLFFGYRLINDQKFLPQIWATVVVMCGIWLSSYYSDFGIVSLLFGQAAMMTDKFFGEPWRTKLHEKHQHHSQWDCDEMPICKRRIDLIQKKIAQTNAAISNSSASPHIVAPMTGFAIKVNKRPRKRRHILQKVRCRGSASAMTCSFANRFCNCRSTAQCQVDTLVSTTMDNPPMSDTLQQAS